MLTGAKGVCLVGGMANQVIDSAGPEQEQQMITELRLSELMGVGREVVRAARASVGCGHVSKGANGAVVWSFAGAMELLAQAGLPLDALGVPLEIGKPEEVTVARTGRNPKIVFCRDRSGAELIVRVRDASLFTVGMCLPVEREGGGHVARLLCRCPRRKGVLGRRLAI